LFNASSRRILSLSIMSAFLSEIVGIREPLFSLTVRNLERASGQSSHDVRLIADLIKQAHSKMKVLGLDAADTKGEELYSALKARVVRDDQKLIEILNVKNENNTGAVLKAIAVQVDKLDMPKQAWVIKKSAAKKLLHDTPPTKIMKHLHHSSVDSMLKRENLSEIYSALRFVESPAWLKRFTKSYKSLKPSDFEIRDVEVIVLSAQRWGTVAEATVRKQRHHITHLKELGVVAILPSAHEVYMPGIALLTLPLVLHYITEIRVYSSFFKLHQVKPHFGKIISEALQSDIHDVATMSGAPIHWRVIQRHYAEASDKDHPEIFAPHVQPEDFYWKKAEEQLFKLDPDLSFWKDADGLAVLGEDKKPISFNVIDNAMSTYTNAPYDVRFYRRAQDAILNELYARYMKHSHLSDQVVKQLDESLPSADRVFI